jgi:hypothetical protein
MNRKNKLYCAYHLPRFWRQILYFAIFFCKISFQLSTSFQGKPQQKLATQVFLPVSMEGRLKKLTMTIYNIILYKKFHKIKNS